MAKHKTIAAENTPDLFSKKLAKVGRPRKPDAMTNAERQAKFRAYRQMVMTGDKIGATIKRFAKEFDLTEDQVTRELLRFALCNRNWGQTGFPGASCK